MVRHNSQLDLDAWVAGSLAAAIILVPYSTVALPYRVALVTQSVAILVLTLAALAVGGRRSGIVRRLLSAPRPLLAGLALYSVAAVLGTLVAIIRGNDLRHTAGQTLSMALLPLGALAGLSLPTRRLPRALSGGVVAGVAAAVTLHLGAWATSLAGGHLMPRLYLSNSVAAVGAILFALLLTLGPLAAGRGRARIAVGGVALLLLIYIFGSGVRSLWIVAPPTLLVLALVHGGRRLRFFLGMGLALLGVVLGSVAIMARGSPQQQHGPPSAVSSTTAVPAPPPLPPWVEILATRAPEAGDSTHFVWQPGPDRRSFVAIPPAEVETDRTYRLQGMLQGSGSGWCHLSMDWFDDAVPPRWLKEVWTDPVLAGRGPRRTAVIAVAPPGARHFRVRVNCSVDAGGRWELSRLEVGPVPSRFLAFARENLGYLLRRSQRGMAALEAPLTATADPSVRFRIEETLRLLHLHLQSPLPSRLLGHGLGATFPLPALGLDDEGRPITVERPNYIHDFYAFLLYKLGVVGSVLVIAALILWTITPLVHLRHNPLSEQRAFLAAAVATWVGYAVWNIACPEFLDFRLAALWGLLVAAEARALRAAQPAPIPPGGEKEGPL